MLGKYLVQDMGLKSWPNPLCGASKRGTWLLPLPMLCSGHVHTQWRRPRHAMPLRLPMSRCSPPCLLLSVPELHSSHPRSCSFSLCRLRPPWMPALSSAIARSTPASLCRSLLHPARTASELTQARIRHSCWHFLASLLTKLSSLAWCQKCVVGNYENTCKLYI